MYGKKIPYIRLWSYIVRFFWTLEFVCRTYSFNWQNSCMYPQLHWYKAWFPLTPPVWTNTHVTKKVSILLITLIVLQGLNLIKTYQVNLCAFVAHHWGILSSDGIPNVLADFFFFFLLFPPPIMAFSDTKHNEGNLALTWYFRKSFL